MPQVLKDAQRKKILESAKREFQKNGISGSSMRVIAVNANTTVGNVYRYYKNKQEIVDAVLLPILDAINKDSELLLSDAMFKEIDIATDYLSAWADNLAEIQSAFPTEMYIIVNDEQINRSYYDNLVLLFMNIIPYISAGYAKDEQGAKIMSRMMAKAIFAGIQEAVSLKCSSDIDKEYFKKILKQFIGSIITMLEGINDQE